MMIIVGLFFAFFCLLACYFVISARFYVRYIWTDGFVRLALLGEGTENMDNQFICELMLQKNNAVLSSFFLAYLLSDRLDVNGLVWDDIWIFLAT